MEPSSEDEQECAPLVRVAQEPEPAAWVEFDVSPQLPQRPSKKTADWRRALTWKVIDRETTANARLVIKVPRGPDLRQGLVEAARFVSLRSPHLQLLALFAIKTWTIWSPDIKHAFIQTDYFHRDVYVRVPPGNGPSSKNRAWEIRMAAFGLNDAPVPFCRTP